MIYIPPLDATINSWFLHEHTNLLTHFFTVIAFFGNWIFLLPLLIILCAFFFTTPLQKYSMPFFISVFSAETATFILKLIVARPRPLHALVVEHDYSFPSGHATIAVAFYGFLVYIAYKQIHNTVLRTAVMVLGVCMVLLIGLSRLYLGVHFFSDIVAGYAVGTLGIAIGLSLRKRFF